ncbi:MAG: class I SAM-dependent methyltransferase [Crocinitomicaceae bacterium]
MNNYQETANTWNKMASLYEKKFMHLAIYNVTYDTILDALPLKRAKILEIGCGPGNIAQYLLKKRADLDYLGTDIAPNMVELAQRNNPSGRFEALDGNGIAQLTTKFHAVICGFILPYIAPEDAESFLVNCFRLLEQNGLLYLSFVEGEPEESGFKTNPSGDRVYFYYYDLEKLKNLLHTIGFEEVNMQKVAFQRSEEVVEYHTILLARKK